VIDRKPGLLDRRRWWVLLGCVGGNVALRVLASANSEFAGVYLAFNVLSVIPLALAIVDFVVHHRDKEWRDADAAAWAAKHGGQISVSD